MSYNEKRVSARLDSLILVKVLFWVKYNLMGSTEKCAAVGCHFANNEVLNKMRKINFVFRFENYLFSKFL